MLSSDEEEELKAKQICSNCIGEIYLQKLARDASEQLVCSYCGDTEKCMTVGDLADHVATAFESHFGRTTNEPDALQWMMLKDDESNYEFERAGDQTVEAIEMAAEIPSDAAQDVQQLLEDQFYDHSSAEIGEETEFDADARYARRGTSDAAWQEEWRSFERALKTEARFFSQSAATHLRSIFRNLHAFQAHDGRPLIVAAGPGFALQFLYRARAFQSKTRLLEAIERPDLHIGSPPAGTASNGRMNARGISVFYGANSPKVAISEVRPPVGSDVVVARFDLTRPVRLLDLTALGKVSVTGSIFDPSYLEALERAMFFRYLSRRITQPVMPDDEAMDYLATQAISDFLATDEEMKLDGIIFPSAQVKTVRTVNVVLFQKAARVEELPLPKGSKISSSAGSDTEDGWESDFEVTESVPPQSTDTPKKKSAGGVFGNLQSSWMSYSADEDYRPSTLRVDTQDVKVHHIEAVQFKTTESNVTRRRHIDSRLAKEVADNESFDF